MKKFIYGLFLCSVLQSGTLRVSAQETPHFTVDSVVVVSLQTPQYLRETGRSISVIRRNTLQTMPVSSADELFRYIPGVEANMRGMGGVQSDFSIRGSTFNQVLVLVDGMRINDPLTGHFNNDLPVSREEIERIEVVRGPASLVYGSDAVGGVINVVTKAFSAFNYENGVNSSGEVALGNQRNLTSSAGIQAATKHFFVRGGLSLNQCPSMPLGTGFHSDYDVRQATVSAAGQIRESTKIAFRITGYLKEFDARNFYTISPSDSAREEMRGYWVQTQLLNDKERKQTRLTISFRENHDDFLFNSLSPHNIHTTHAGTVQFTRTRLLKRITFTYGLQGHLRTIQSTDRGNHSETQAGFFGNFAYKPGETIAVVSGLRGELHEIAGLQMIPQISVSWKPGKWYLHASAGKSVRNPDFTERFVSTALPWLAPGRNLGNPRLLPEKSWTFDLGADRKLSGFFTAGVTIFTRNSRNLIDYILTNSRDIPENNNLVPDTGYFYAGNVRFLSTQGLEGYLTGEVPAGPINIQATAGLMLLKSSNRENIITKYIAGHAKQLVTGNLAFTHGPITFSLSSIYKIRKKPEYAPAINTTLPEKYIVFNSSLEWNLFSNRFSVLFITHNLTDVKYADVLGAGMPRRWFSAGIRWNSIGF
ncbi:MAG: TonB-dependent receptor plug domain-containing protein [Bacteroidales bacterium]